MENSTNKKPSVWERSVIGQDRTEEEWKALYRRREIQEAARKGKIGWNRFENPDMGIPAVSALSFEELEEWKRLEAGRRGFEYPDAPPATVPLPPLPHRPDDRKAMIDNIVRELPPIEAKLHVPLPAPVEDVYKFPADDYIVDDLDPVMQPPPAGKVWTDEEIQKLHDFKIPTFEEMQKALRCD